LLATVPFGEETGEWSLPEPIEVKRGTRDEGDGLVLWGPERDRAGSI